MLQEFQSKFAREACEEYLSVRRWPDGSVCPMREPAGLSIEATKARCAACRLQVSLTAGTIFDCTKTPLTVWFWAAYLMTTDQISLRSNLAQPPAQG
jgi:hypothetical protein